MNASDGSDPFPFDDVVRGLENGDFSRLEPVFVAVDDDDGRPPIVRWCVEGRFDDLPRALAEALTCACFLGRTAVAEYLLKRGIDPAGGAGTGLNAFHWAANRGQPGAVRLLLRWQAPLDVRNMYGGNVLETAVWAAIHEPRPGQHEVIEELLAAGARLEDGAWPTGHAEVDAILRARHAR